MAQTHVVFLALLFAAGLETSMHCTVGAALEKPAFSVPGRVVQVPGYPALLLLLPDPVHGPAVGDGPGPQHRVVLPVEVHRVGDHVRAQRVDQEQVHDVPHLGLQHVEAGAGVGGGVALLCQLGVGGLAEVLCREVGLIVQQGRAGSQGGHVELDVVDAGAIVAVAEEEVEGSVRDLGVEEGLGGLEAGQGHRALVGGQDQGGARVEVPAAGGHSEKLLLGLTCPEP